MVFFAKPNQNNPKINLRNTKSNTVSENSIIVCYMLSLNFRKGNRWYNHRKVLLS